MQGNESGYDKFYANGRGKSISFSIKELEPPYSAEAERAIISTLYVNPRETYEKLKEINFEAEGFYI